MQRLDIQPIYSVPYQPQYQPCEQAFAKIKNAFRKLRLQKIVGLDSRSQEILIAEAVGSVTQQDVQNWVRHCKGFLK